MILYMRLGVKGYHVCRISKICSQDCRQGESEFWLAKLYQAKLSCSLSQIYVTIPSYYLCTYIHTIQTYLYIRMHTYTYLHTLLCMYVCVLVVQYFVDVIREQQLIKWGQEHSSGGPFNEGKSSRHNSPSIIIV